jgi:acyl carrier protein
LFLRSNTLGATHLRQVSILGISLDVETYEGIFGYGGDVAASGKIKVDTRNMLDRDINSTTDRVAGLILRMLSERSLGTPTSPDDDLRSLGMSSLDMVNLVLSVESEFDLSIPEADITPTKFRSIATIGKLVGSLLAPM